MPPLLPQPTQPPNPPRTRTPNPQKKRFVLSGMTGRFEVNFGLYGYSVDGCTGVQASLFPQCRERMDAMDRLMQNGAFQAQLIVDNSELCERSKIYKIQIYGHNSRERALSA